MHRISKQEAAEFPLFNSHEEAINYFEEKYGERFVLEESSDTNDGLCFFYRLITDEDAYIKGVSDLNSTGYIAMEFMNSYQPIQIMENGSIQVDQ